jgi:hypothetical protein|tara:strand:- start:521 stop:694 length:174 start_codon:yes stop_codon:yes gene_type:complete
MKYIVWVGGTIIYEGNKKSVADRREQQFIDWGYDDVITEAIGAIEEHMEKTHSKEEK